MNLANIRQSLTDIYGNTLTSSDSYYNRIINLAYRKIASMADWWWLEDTWVLSCRAYAANFTGTVTQGSTSITGVAAVSTADSFTAYYTARMWVETEDRVFEVTAANATAQTLTIDSSWIDDSSTAQAFTMWKDTYDLPTVCAGVRNVIPRNHPNHMPLRQVLPDDIDAFGMFISDQATEIADRFCVAMTPDATLSVAPLQIRIFPPPDRVSEYLVKYSLSITDMAADADVPIIPGNHHTLLVDMAKVELLKNEGEDADRIQAFENEVARGMMRMNQEQSRRGGVLKKFGRKFGTLSAPPMPFTMSNTEGIDY